MRRGIKLIIAILWFAFAFPLFASEPDPPKVEEAKLSVHGYGLFGNRELKALLKSLEIPGEKLEFFKPNYIEDAVLVLFSKLQRDGYLYPRITVEATTENGEVKAFSWDQPLGEPVPREMLAHKLNFIIDPGVLFYYENISFDGVHALTLEQAAHFFIETDAIIKLKHNRIFSPDRLRASIKNLEEALERKGYESAVVTRTNLVINTNTGIVLLDVFVNEGLQSMVRTIRRQVDQAPPSEPIQTNIVYNQIWLQDFVLELKREYYKQGYADVTVDVTQEGRQTLADKIHLDLLAKVTTGKQVVVGDVEFHGERQTKESMLRQRVNLHSGDLLNPVKAEEGRYKLARLGIFDTVELRYEQQDDGTRDIIYDLHEGKTFTFSLLAGYGSYERLRGGFELEQYNLWGLGHQTRLRAMQSFKASQAEYTYTIPQIVGKDFDVFATASGLRREEISFTREEFGGGAGISRHFREISSDVSVRYNYQVLNATRLEVLPAYGLQSANVGSFIFDLRHDRRDNPLTPRAGYKIFSNLEIASESLAGEVDYQRFEMSASYHLPIGRLHWLHFGFSHGFVTTGSGPAKDLPFNKRFFPGGDNSIRGYQFGEAAPRDDDGNLVGGESYMLGNIEFEQGITRSLSFVLFADALGNARGIEDYPFNEGLYSVGGGLRWKTLIGPARLEYGYNLHRREEDPMGTLHFSIGFPF
jgi:outer membrane protein assembly complex protein YaeT